MPAVNSAMRAVLASAVDYAGLFPPAGLGMEEAVANYRRYLSGSHRWMLGSFILPIGAIKKLEDALAQLRGRKGGTWPVSLLLGPDPFVAIDAVEPLRERWRDRLAIGSVEVAPLPAEQIPLLAGGLPEDVTAFFELPLDSQLEERLQAVADAGACAKIRTGGVTPDAIPSVVETARFVALCHDRSVPFKATAGLHHAIRGPQKLTYEDDSECAWMHGFLNLSIAAALVDTGEIGEDGIVEVLSESSAYAFGVRSQELIWRDRRVDTDGVARSRRGFFHSFGSCSFEEPIADLSELGLS